ncbi:MAG: hypothetical protein IPI10_07535 [Bacteroidetes bacterium]|nr:hypothetical protein [Bacteroidota bacterium]
MIANRHFVASLLGLFLAKAADIFYPFIRQLKLTAMKTLAILFTTAKRRQLMVTKGRVAIGFSQNPTYQKSHSKSPQTNTKNL